MPRCWRCNSFVTQYQQWLPSHPARLHHTQSTASAWSLVYCLTNSGSKPYVAISGKCTSLNTWNIQWYAFLTNWSRCYFSHWIHWPTWYTNVAHLCGFLNSFHSCCTTAMSINCSHSVFSSFQHLSSASHQNLHFNTHTSPEALNNILQSADCWEKDLPRLGDQAAKSWNLTLHFRILLGSFYGFRVQGTQHTPTMLQSRSTGPKV
jgi:hypothetical protein